jgi:hypothetical protein
MAKFQLTNMRRFLELKKEIEQLAHTAEINDRLESGDYRNIRLALSDIHRTFARNLETPEGF